MGEEAEGLVDAADQPGHCRLPMPGFPEKTRWRVMIGLFSPASVRSFSTRSTATCR
jgi:hypothetical protein